MPALLKYILWPVILYLAYCGFLFLLQRQIMFPRYQIPQPAQSEPKIGGLEKIWLAIDGGTVEAWFLPPLDPQMKTPAPAVIFGHGNGELIDFWPQELERFTRLGIAVLLVEYPGYGRSAGKPSEKSITRTFVAAYDTLTSRQDIDPARIIFFGRSMGGGAVCALARHRPSATLILMSTFTSAKSLAKKFLLPPFLVRDPFDNLAVVKNYPDPVLIIHGRHDSIIPFSHGKALHEAAQQGEMIAYNAGHNDCPPDWNVFWQDVEGFLLENNIIAR
ncbi:MAG: alpha/beta hydrolase [Proteobacteria bacterium]|nr:alpha/beta hydrolase [Pseudomonadota bacterium]